jgi:hypothetical protein
MYVYSSRNNEARSRSHCCRGKAITIKYSGCNVCSLRYPACNAHALCCHAWSTTLYSIFPHCLINCTRFEYKVTEHKMCVLIFSTNLSETFLILRRIQWDIAINEQSSGKVPVILVRFQRKFNIQYLWATNCTAHSTHHSLKHFLPQHCWTFNDVFLLIIYTKL